MESTSYSTMSNFQLTFQVGNGEGKGSGGWGGICNVQTERGKGLFSSRATLEQFCSVIPQRRFQLQT